MTKFQTAFALSLVLAVVQSGAARAEEIHFDGSQLTHHLQLTGDQTHTIYENREVESTCYRNETQLEQVCRSVERQQCGIENERVCRDEGVDKCEDITTERCSAGPQGIRICAPTTEQHCEHIPHEVCRIVPHTVCHSYYEPYCSMEPVTRTVAYSCTQVISVPVGEQLDYHVRANVSVNFTGVPSGASADERLSVAFDGYSVRITSIESSNEVVLLESGSSSEHVVGNQQKVIDSVINVRVLPAAALSETLARGLTDLKVTGSVVQVTMGKVVTSDLLKVSLDLARARLLGDQQKFKGLVPADALLLKETPNGTTLMIELSKLRLAEPMKPGEKLSIGLGVEIQAPSPHVVLNPGALKGALKASLKKTIRSAKL